ncbi:uncharacterized protein SPPG_06937 [Spizellomyces punctatus DAOM BR117]|uniref:Lem3/Cdc50 n=1 Tax=Spizellomyces punctatus (strain DAOM BR117) TaxID=645134 RepID=A0A0L0HAM6_SPIPD|nr:uncharacterized protein SPPG_06937 [Spizellomyces punctatus DAOM BR117]KNC97949.1 hypothetical protein SPPG_06937 [Spizellomyces punctatus DAOM BR117]|eukprot:XP_016605989.1 hypothetical protein SPPG_06937 [Spizellomyces punctatus DAOM BR117]
MASQSRHRNTAASHLATPPESQDYELVSRSVSQSNPSSTPSTQPKKKNKKDKPWKQQRLPAWFPILTPTLVAIPLIVTALIFIPIGAWIYHTESQVGEVIFDYTDCSELAAPTFAPPPQGSKYQHVSAWQYDPTTKKCSLQLNLTWSLPPPVFLYVRLTNFYQNHRLYTKSVSADQLNGKVYMDAKDIPGDCSWLRYANCDRARQENSWSGSGNMADMNPDCRTAVADRAEVIKNATWGAQYYPCGLVANSMFSDDISALTCISTPDAPSCPVGTYIFSERNIAWEEDRWLYNPSSWFTTPSLASDVPTNVIPPPAWRSAFPAYKNGYNSSNYPDIKTWERFQVWMRKAGFPTFRKLWGRNDEMALNRGVWQVDIVDSFEVKRFDGTKSFVVSTLGPLGSRGGFAGIAYLVVGGLAALSAFLVFVVRVRKLGDESYLSWNNPPKSE